MKNIKRIKFLMFSLVVAFLGCQENNDYEFGQIITPSNISITAEIIGADEANPNGDGSGVVKFTATADNAVSYKFVYNNTENVSTSGVYEYSFSNLGLNTYTVSVVASGTAGVSSSKTIQVDVLSTYSPPQDLLDLLIGNGTRTFRIKNEATGHFGVGPRNTKIPSFYSAAPDDKAGLGMYDDRYTFNTDGSFTAVTNGDVLGKAVPLIDVFGPSAIEANSDGDIENYVLADYNANWQLTAPGGIETISLTNNGFLGFYVGVSDFEILSRTANEMVLISKGFDGNNWYITLIAE